MLLVSFRNSSMSAKISEIWQKVLEKHFPGDFSPEKISSGELSDICWNKMHVYSRKFVLCKHVAFLQILLWQMMLCDIKISEKFPGGFRKHLWYHGYKLCKTCLQAVNYTFIYKILCNFFFGIFRNVSLTEKISEIYQNCQKYFLEEFSLEEISPWELSRICWNKTHVSSRKFVLFRTTTSL